MCLSKLQKTVPVDTRISADTDTSTGDNNPRQQTFIAPLHSDQTHFTTDCSQTLFRQSRTRIKNFGVGMRLKGGGRVPPGPK